MLSGLRSGNSSDSNGGEQNPCSGAVGGRLIHRLLSFTILKLCVCDVNDCVHNFGMVKNLKQHAKLLTIKEKINTLTTLKLNISLKVTIKSKESDKTKASM